MLLLYCWIYTNTALGYRNTRVKNCMLQGVEPSVWELLHTDSFCGYKSQADALVTSARAEPKATWTAPVCLSYCDILPAVTLKNTSSTHFHHDRTLYKIPAKWNERQIHLMVAESNRESEAEREKMSTHLSDVTMLMLFPWGEALMWHKGHSILHTHSMLTSFSERKQAKCVCMWSVCI